MKRYFFYFVALFSLIFVSCTTKPSTPVKNTVGDAYDVLVLCDDEPWSGDLAMAVCDLLEEDMAGLTRPQGYFDIVKQRLRTSIRSMVIFLLLASTHRAQSLRARWCIIAMPIHRPSLC